MPQLYSQEWKDKISVSQKARLAAASPELRTAGNKAVVAALAARRLHKTCPTCKETFSVPPNGRRAQKVFCSRPCFWEPERVRRRDARKPRPQKNCLYCNSAFVQPPNHCRDMRFCSVGCRAKWQAELPWDEWRGKLSKNRANRARGDKNGMWGMAPPHGKWVSYQRKDGTLVRMRSRWESAAATYLDLQCIAWEYEPARFKLLDRTYMPDFWLPGLGVYWEIKGWMHARHAETIRQFRICNPTIPLVVIGPGSMRGIAAKAGVALSW